jgi:putative hydrolase of the HAD superfamily
VTGAVFFDAVGTLLHPDPPVPEVYARAGQRHGSRLTPADVLPRFRTAFRRQEEVDRRFGLRTNEGREHERWQAIVAEVFDDLPDTEGCFQELWDHFARPEAWRVDATAADALGELARAGWQVGIASNFDARLRGIVRGLPALRPVGPLVISSEVGWRKPAPEFFAAVCRAAGLPPQRIFLVGDDLVNDHEGARMAGLGALLLDPEGSIPLDPGEKVTSLAQVVDRLRQETASPPGSAGVS